jgi:hypothetical protein
MPEHGITGTTASAENFKHNAQHFTTILTDREHRLWSILA